MTLLSIVIPALNEEKSIQHIWTFLKGLNTRQGFRSAVRVGWQTLRFVAG